MTEKYSQLKWWRQITGLSHTPPERITIMTSGTPRGTDSLPHAGNGIDVFSVPRPALSSSVVGSPGISVYFFLAAWGIFASSLFGQPLAGQTELARGAAPSNPGPKCKIRRFSQ